MKTVIDILEKNKTQTQSTNTHLKKILCNTTTNNPTITNKYINSTDHISRKELTPEGREIKNTTTETEGNNLLDSKEKKMQVNKTQSQNNEKKLYINWLNFNEDTTFDSASSCSQCEKDDHEFMIKCSECRAWIHYQFTELPLYVIASLVKGRRKYSYTFCINVN